MTIGASSAMALSGGPAGVFGDIVEFDAALPVVFGADMINASACTNAMILIGDTNAASELAIYGNDLIVGGMAGDQLFGDFILNPAGFSHGGNDRIFGNGGNDSLSGGGGDDYLDGGANNDSMNGGFGNDTYVVDSALDTLVEIADFNGGTDTVRTSLAFTLGDFFENLYLTGATGVTATGNELNNIILGNAGANTINGGEGMDSMSGGGGTDIYVVDDVGDRVSEGVSGGSDSVISAVNFTLGANIESLRLIGKAVAAVGNNLGNSLVANAFANVLDGGLGNDFLHGEEGNDTLTGGGGLDKFVFRKALGSTNIDTITDFVVADDTIQLSAAIFATAGPVGTLAAGAYKEIGFAGAAAVDASDRIIHNRATGDIVFDADGSGAGAAVLFAKVGTGLVMTAADFQIIA